MLDAKCLEKIADYLNSGELTDNFQYSDEERRYEILDFLEKLIELGENADAVATKLIFKDSYLGALVDKDSGDKAQK